MTKNRYLNILLTDLAGFTRWTRTLTRDELSKLIEQHRQIVLPLVATHGGRVVKEIGDSFLCVFESPTDALIASREIRQSISRQSVAGGPWAARVIITGGEVTEIEGDVFGDAVNLAAKLEALCPEGHIWSTEHVIKSAKGAEIDARPLGNHVFPGTSESVQVWEVFPLVTIHLLQDFEPNNGTEGEYYSDIWRSNPKFETERVHSGSRSLRISVPEGGGTVAIYLSGSQQTVDMTGVKTISIWMFNPQGNDGVELRIKDAKGHGGTGPDYKTLWSSNSSEKNKWTRMVWNLPNYPQVDDLDLSQIKHVELFLLHKGYYLFDHLEMTRMNDDFEAVRPTDLGDLRTLLSTSEHGSELNTCLTAESRKIRQTNLPKQPTRFIGRQKELTEIRKHLDDPSCRLLSLVGIGGVGKTRLAIQAASEALEAFRDGTFFASLSSISSPDLLWSRIAEALQFTFFSQEEPKNQLMNYLREKNILLVLDHFDELVEKAAILTELLAAAPKLKFLISCRQRLQVRGEWVIEIEGLDYPRGKNPSTKKQYTSIQLFVESAQRVKADFDLTEDDLPFVVGICRLVQGLPLGLELASAWVRALSCSEIQKEIESNRDFLVSTTKGLPEEHKSLRAIFEYSWKILTEEERRVMEELSLFKSEFGREAAEKICGAALPILTGLVDKSVLHRTPSGRYEVHQVIRQYLQEKLMAHGEADAGLKTRFCEYYAHYLHARSEGRSTRDQSEALEEVAEEIENVREAWRYAVELRAGRVLEGMLLGLFYFCEIRGLFKEGEMFLGDAIGKLERHEDVSIVVAKMRCRRARLLNRLGLYEEAKRQIEECLPRFVALNEKREVGDCLSTLGIIAGTSGDHAQARQYYLQAQMIFSEDQNERGKAWSLNLQGITEEQLGNFGLALAIHRDALGLYMAIGDENGVAWSLVNLGNINVATGSFAEARTNYKRALRIYLKIRDQAGIASSLINLGRIDEAFGDYAMAARLHQRSRMIYQELGEQRGMTRALMLEGNALESMGRFEEAERLFSQGLELSKALGDQSAVYRSLANLAGVRNQLADFKAAHDLFEKALRLARQIGEQDTIAWLLSNLGGIALATGDYAKAKQRFRESMEIYHGIGGRAGLAWVLVNFGDLQCQLGEYDEAKRLMDRGHTIYEEVGEKRGMAWAFMGSGNLAKARGEISEARGKYEQALQIYSATADSRGLAWAKTCIGGVDVIEGRGDQALALLDEGMKIFRKVRDRRGTVLALLGMANLKTAGGDFNGAESLFLEAATICEDIGAAPLHLDVLLGIAALFAAKERSQEAGEVLMHILAHPCRKRETEEAANRLLQRVAAGVTKTPPTVRKPTVKSLRKILARDG